MVSKKKLVKLYQDSKCPGEEYKYYTAENFIKDAKSYLKDIKKENVVCSMAVSRSGMTRHFNNQHYNMLLNICFNQKMSWDRVRVSGCGMNMYWHLLFTACEYLATKGEIEKHRLNLRCSHQTII